MKRSNRWRSHVIEDKTIFNILDTNFARLERQNDECLPNLHRTNNIVVTSDYSGEHAGTGYVIYSFLIADLEGLQEWDRERSIMRDTVLLDNRRMSFKRLNDKQRLRALTPFLAAANQIPGLCFTVAIDTKIESLFQGNSPLDLDNPNFSEFTEWTSKTLEKAFVVLHTLSFLLSGLARPGQNILWITDEDSIAANDDRLRQLSTLFGWVMSSYLTFDLGHLRCATTKSDDGSRRIEDLTSIPDLVAGAVAEQLELNKELPEEYRSTVFWMSNGNLAAKTSSISNWLADASQPLKRLICFVDDGSGRTGPKVSWFHFDNQQSE